MELIVEVRHPARECSLPGSVHHGDPCLSPRRRGIALASRGRGRTATWPSANARMTASGTTRTSDDRDDGVGVHAGDELHSRRRSRPPASGSTSPGSMGSCGSTRRARSPPSRARSQPDYTVARTAAEAFYARLRELFAEGEQITTFGPYSPGQAVVMKRMGIEAIYLGGWATSAKGSADRGSRPRPRELSAQPGPGRGGRPRSRAADRRQEPAFRPRPDGRASAERRRRRSTSGRSSSPTPTPGHGGDAHVRNLIRRFVEVGVPGLPHRGPEAGRQEVRPPGRQGARRPGRAEQAAQRRAPPARHHAGAGHHRRPDRRRGRDVPRRSQRRARPAVHPRARRTSSCRATGSASSRSCRRSTTSGSTRSAATCCSRCPRRSRGRPRPGSSGSGCMSLIERNARPLAMAAAGAAIDSAARRHRHPYVEVWQAEAGLKTYGEAVADVLEFRDRRGRAVRR